MPTEQASSRRVRTRFAPSPTGFLHVGAFRTALFSYLLAKRFQGDFILRIEDTDQNRLVPGALDSIIRSLQALGLFYDEGPDAEQVGRLDAEKYGGVTPGILPEHGGDFGPYFQSLRLPRYDAALERLLEEGKAYFAFETPEELAAQRAAADARKVPYRYNRRYRDYPLGQARDRVAAGEPAVIRFKMPVEGPIVCVDYLRGKVVFEAETEDDFIIRKADGFPPYHLAAIVDDYEMQVSHVLRGDEWLSSFPKHVCLYQAFDWQQPVWVHTPSVLGNDKKKLSKRHGAKPIIGPVPELKEGKLTGELLAGMVNQEGFLPEAMVNFLALIGWSAPDNRELLRPDELIAEFTLDRVSLSPGVFDIEKLEWMNGVYIRSLTPDELAKRVLPFMQEAGLLSSNPAPEERAYMAEVIALEQERIRRLSEAPEATAFFFGELPDFGSEEGETAVRKWLRKDGASVAAFLKATAEALSGLSGWTTPAIEEAVRTVGARLDRSAGNITHPVRVATTGREKGPGLFELMTVLGKDKTIRRLTYAIGLTAAGDETAETGRG
ncbi:MAG: glutamate--tRNA ligase [Capsulimonadales bacterium]|nr:glutamate--tRNA ligase [Capsulimonadales bacterium]